MIGLALSIALAAAAPGDLRVAGSSTVAPLIAEAASNGYLNDVIVAPTGTVRGFEELCSEAAVSLIGASRRLTPEEADVCAEHGVNELVEVMIDTDGIVLAQSSRRGAKELTLQQLYLAAGAMVPRGDECSLEANHANTWRDVDRSLPARTIRFFGPPVSSGTRDMFIRLGIAAGARTIPCLARLEEDDPELFLQATMPRHGDAWVDAGENDEATAVALTYVRDAVGIFGVRSFEGAGGLDAVYLEGVEPTRDAVASGTYPLSRPLFLYLTADALDRSSARLLVYELEKMRGEALRVKVHLTKTGETRFGLFRDIDELLKATASLL
ncbi:MAG: substrate-binding domain-containing protein [Pseudomonadota bacterium]